MENEVKKNKHPMLTYFGMATIWVLTNVLVLGITFAGFFGIDGNIALVVGAILMALFFLRTLGKKMRQVRFMGFLRLLALLDLVWWIYLLVS